MADDVLRVAMTGMRLSRRSPVLGLRCEREACGQENTHKNARALAS